MSPLLVIVHYWEHALQHTELCSVTCGDLNGLCVYVKLIHCTSEQLCSNKNWFKNLKNKKKTKGERSKSQKKKKSTAEF